MAKRTAKPVDGEMRHGPSNDNVTGQGIFYTESGGPSTDVGGAGRGSVHAFDARSAAGVITTFYLWFDTSGNLRGSTTFPVSTESNGTIISATPAI